MSNINCRQNLRPLVIAKGEMPFNTIPVRLYDLTIEDIHERRQKSEVKRSLTVAAAYLGVSIETVTVAKNVIAGKPSRKVWSPVHKKHFAIRVEHEANNLK